MKVGNDQDAEKDRSPHEQDCLDDLHPGRRKHASEDHIDDHQDAHSDDGGVVADAGIFQQQRDQGAGADHLGNHVEGTDG
jgi:hypothetical protein